MRKLTRLSKSRDSDEQNKKVEKEKEKREEQDAGGRLIVEVRLYVTELCASSSNNSINPNEALFARFAIKHAFTREKTEVIENFDGAKWNLEVDAGQ